MQEKSLNLLKKKLIDLDFRNDWIPEFINYIEQCIKKDAILILLFGSRAKLDFHKDSDIDVSLLSPKTSLMMCAKERLIFSAIHCLCNHSL